MVRLLTQLHIVHVPVVLLQLNRVPSHQIILRNWTSDKKNDNLIVRLMMQLHSNFEDFLELSGIIWPWRINTVSFKFTFKMFPYLVKHCLDTKTEFSLFLLCFY